MAEESREASQPFFWLDVILNPKGARGRRKNRGAVGGRSLALKKGTRMSKSLRPNDRECIQSWLRTVSSLISIASMMHKPEKLST